MKRYNRTGYTGKCDYRDPRLFQVRVDPFLNLRRSFADHQSFFSGFHQSWTLNSPDKNTGRRLIIFLVRLVRPAENVAVQKGAARKQHLSVCQSTSWISGGGGGRVSVPLLIPALVLPEDTLADTHLKKPANAVESSVSRDTTLSVSCFKCSWPALGPTAQAMMDRIPGRESLLPLHRTPWHQKGFHQSSGIPEDASLLWYHHLSDVHPVQHTASDIQGQHR